MDTQVDSSLVSDCTQTQVMDGTQTQHILLCNPRWKLKSLVPQTPGFLIPEDLSSFTLGRLHTKIAIPLANLTVKDARVSTTHLVFTRERDTCDWHVTNHGTNGSHINGVKLQRGETRQLTHLDEVSVIVNPDRHRQEPLNPAYDPVGVWVWHDMHHDRPPPGEENTQVYAEYQFTKPIGTGNFSQVVMGKHKKTSLNCAIKIIDKHKFMQFKHSQQSRVQLRDEMELLRGLSHPNIVSLLQFEESERRIFLIMELCTGGDMLNYIMDKGALLEAHAVCVFRQICEGLQYLHINKIVHRDIKPENVLFSEHPDQNPNFIVKLADFGLARNSVNADLRTVCGTPHYMAPELITAYMHPNQGEGCYGSAVDLWSLGVVLYVMLCAQPPFHEEGLYESIASGAYDFTPHAFKHISSSAKDLIRRLMRVNPQQRMSIEQTLSHEWLNSTHTHTHTHTHTYIPTKK
eukprot:GHVR01177611.1.p1 GENE.GHVR01177611.1~~GHVR01177611.1.p1  ORF type:complete len:474 (-),score=100.68 GHVR01177611.1:412-1794(-)